MIKNVLNKIYVNQIAKEVCNDEICKASVSARLNYLNDSQFNIVLANLNAAKSYLCYITNVTQGSNATRARVHFVFKDIISGSSSSGYAEVPYNKANDVYELFRVMNFNYIGLIETPEGKRYFSTKPSAGGYNITLTRPSGGSGSYVTPGGSLVTPGGSVPGSTAPGSVQTPGGSVPSSTEGFLSKAALAVAAYFLFK